MSHVSNRNYHLSRAEDELRLAGDAADPVVAKIHRQLAALHKRRMLEIVHLGEPQLSPYPLIGARQPQADR